MPAGRAYGVGPGQVFRHSSAALQNTGIKYFNAYDLSDILLRSLGFSRESNKQILFLWRFPPGGLEKRGNGETNKQVCAYLVLKMQ